MFCFGCHSQEKPLQEYIHHVQSDSKPGREQSVSSVDCSHKLCWGNHINNAADKGHSILNL